MKQKHEPKEQVFSRKDDFASCSSTDCTGLIPAGLNSQAEAEAYQELYPYVTPPVLLKQEDETKDKTDARSRSSKEQG